jgi:hypothetical protein
MSGDQAPFLQEDGSYHVVLHRWEYVGRSGAMLGFSDQYPDRQFLVVPGLGFSELDTPTENTPKQEQP